MEEERKQLVYRLFKKGKENFSDFDRLLIESDEEIKDQLTRLFSLDEETYRECDDRIEKAIAERMRNQKHHPMPVKRFPIRTILPAAAAIILILLFPIRKLLNPPVMLGGGFHLFISPSEEPYNFIASGGFFPQSKEISLAFLPTPGSQENLRQGMIFSFSPPGELIVHYRYDNARDILDLSEPTRVAEKVTLPPGSGYFIFGAYLSPTPFEEDKVLSEIRKIITNTQGKIDLIEKKAKEKYKKQVIKWSYLKEKT